MPRSEGRRSLKNHSSRNLSRENVRGACAIPHWTKLAVGGALTNVCAFVFITLFKRSLIPIGSNYATTQKVPQGRHTAMELAAFGAFKLAAMLFSMGSGGVSAMFVPLFLSCVSYGAEFSQSVVHDVSTDPFAAVGMVRSSPAVRKHPWQRSYSWQKVLAGKCK